jgi:type IV pilus assembly protein PilE
MIVVVIVGILAAIALPAYQNQVKKGNRSAAQQLLLDIVTKEQQILMDGRTYVAVANGNFPNKPSASPPGIGLTPPDSLTGKYTFEVSNVVMTATPPTFLAKATAASGQQVDANSVQITVDHAGLRQYRNSGGSATGTW